MVGNKTFLNQRINTLIKNIISKVIHKNNLTIEESILLTKKLLKSELSKIDALVFLTALSTKGESYDEIIGCIKSMMDFSKIKCNPKMGFDLFDICGTGRNKINTFNISTAVSIIGASAGLKIVKLGSGAISSKCGSIDLLNELNIKICSDINCIKNSLKKDGIVFLNYSELFNFQGYQNYRSELWFETIFDSLGPFMNPIQPHFRIIGVNKKELMDLFSNILNKMSIKRGLVVYGTPGMDEISNIGKTYIHEINTGKIKKWEINPEDFGIKLSKPSEIMGWDPKKNAEILKDVFNGLDGSYKDIILLNAASLIYLSQKENSYERSLDVAEKIINSGKAYEKLEQLIVK